MGEKIETHASGLRWIRGVGESERWVAIESLFGDVRGASPLQSLTFDSGPGPMEPHYHTAGLAAAITKGRLALDVGDDISERLLFGPGDIVFVPSRLYHGEEILEGGSIVATIAYAEPFEVVEERRRANRARSSIPCRRIGTGW